MFKQVKTSMIILSMGLSLQACSLFHKPPAETPIQHVSIAYANADWRICADDECQQHTHKSLLVVKDQPVQPPDPPRPLPVHMEITHQLQPKPAVAKQEWNEEKAVIHFRTGKSVAYDHSELDEILAQVQQINSNEVLVVSGYTDNKGSRRLNQKLAHSRASWVANWLKRQGVKNPIVQRGSGKCCYIVDNNSDQHRAMNRRAVVIISTENGGNRDSEE